MLKKSFRYIVQKTTSFVMNRASSNLDYALQNIARDNSAQFIYKNLINTHKIYTRDQILSYASQEAKHISGCICEFGVFQGYTLKLLSNFNPEKNIYGFDSFEGLPSDWRSGFLKGEFKTTIPLFNESNIALYKGWFSDTIPSFISEKNEKISLLHIDCDLYESTRCVFDHLWDHLADGAIIVFDEYFNYPGWEDHEHKALSEVKGNFIYLAYNPQGQQVIIKKT